MTQSRRALGLKVLKVVAVLVVIERLARFASKQFIKSRAIKPQPKPQRQLQQHRQPENEEEEEEEEVKEKVEEEEAVEDDSSSTHSDDSLTTADHTAPIGSFNPQEASGVQLVDGKTAASFASYAFSEVAFVYPVSETQSSLGEITSDWTAHGGKNSFGSSVKVLKLESRSGAAAALHGALTGGALATAFAPSEALLPMIPNLARIVADRLPAVVHVEARGVDLKGDLSVYVNHSEVIAAAQTGVSILSSASPQEAHDIAIAAHVAALKASAPVLHFFDGVRSAKEVTNVQLLPYTDLARLITPADLEGLHTRTLTPANSLVPVIEQTLKMVGNLTGRDYRLFEYLGAPDATSALVMLAAGSQPAEEAVRHLVAAGKKVGLLKVRVFRPWSPAHFLAALPTSVKHVSVLDQASSLSVDSYGQLFADVIATFSSAAGKRAIIPKVISGRTGGVACKELRPEMIAPIFDNLIAEQPKTFFTVGAGNTFTDLPVAAKLVATSSSSSSYPAESNRSLVQAVFWDTEGPNSVAHEEISLLLGRSLGQSLQTVTKADAYAKAATVLNTHLRFAPEETHVDPFPSSEIRSADLVFLHDASLLSHYNVLGNARTGATLLINVPWKAEEVEAKLPATLKRDVYLQKISLYLVNTAALVESVGLAPSYTSIALQAAFLQLSGLPEGILDLKHAVRLAHRSGKDPKLAQSALSVIDKTLAGLVPHAIPADWEIATPDESLLPFFVSNSLYAAPTPASLTPSQGPTSTEKWHRAAWSLMFPEAYSTQPALRPETPGTYLVTLTENKRVTPTDYDRNVFHMEFDTTNTGLKYEIGDALGVHGHNHPDDVREFLQFYGLNPQEVVAIKRSQKGEHGAGVERRTIEQLFTQHLDIFGRPTKRFYKALSEWANSSGEKQKLDFLVSSEGAAEFKQRVAETQTYADILQEFTSAHPPVEALLELIPAIKPRHYSIASSMKVHPNSVHLLVVLVDWETPQGKKRFGQCTRYLSALKPGSSVTVSVKPSVMKLPPVDSTPVIMAGLGTGMAPFRAFIEERAYAKSQGVEVGPMVLYFGSRHRSQEYLYGEELEAYHADGVLTHLRLAFSRDQKEKVYIQNKIQEDSEILSDYLLNQKGHFYLCGPTWPAGDVRDAISSAFQTVGGMTAKEASKTINEMKDHERYILEVY